MQNLYYIAMHIYRLILCPKQHLSLLSTNGDCTKFNEIIL